MRCPCNENSSQCCRIGVYSSFGVTILLTFVFYFLIRCDDSFEESCMINFPSKYSTFTLLVSLFVLGGLFLYVRSRFNPGMYDEEIEGAEEVEEQKPPEYEFILESDRNILSSMYPDICDSGTWYNPEYPPPTINTAKNLPKIQVYEPPKYPKPPGFEESTGVYEADEDGISVLDVTGSRSGWYGSSSMFGSQMTGLNSRTDLSMTNSRFSITSVSRNSRRTISGRY